MCFTLHQIGCKSSRRFSKGLFFNPQSSAVQDKHRSLTVWFWRWRYYVPSKLWELFFQCRGV